MNAQKPFSFGCRIPGRLLLNILAKAIQLPLKKQWQLNPREESNHVSLLCVNCHDHKVEVVSSVQIKIAEEIVPDCFYRGITFELIVEGHLNNLLAKNAVLSDFESIKWVVKESLKRYQSHPFRIFEHQDMQLADS